MTLTINLDTAYLHNLILRDLMKEGYDMANAKIEPVLAKRTEGHHLNQAEVTVFTGYRVTNVVRCL